MSDPEEPDERLQNRGKTPNERPQTGVWAAGAGGYLRRLLQFGSAAVLLTLVACGGRRDPVQDLIRDLNRYPEFSLIVDDLRVDDGFFADYFLRFRILTASGQRIANRDTLVYKQRVSEWMKVPEAVFGRYEHYLAMVVASKTDDGRTTGVRQAHPPGYQYVGNSRYGHWGGGGFWQFYGQYAFMSAMLGGHRIGRQDYNGYRGSHGRGRPYFGPSQGGRPAFGTSGSVTEKTRPKFFQRQRQRLSSGGRGFGTRGRSGGSRSRGGFGK